MSCLGVQSPPPSSSKFVECPSCNRPVSYAMIHIHLDRCLASNTAGGSEKNGDDDDVKDTNILGRERKRTTTTTTATTKHISIVGDNNDRDGCNLNRLHHREHETEKIQKIHKTRKTTTTTANSEQNNAFRHMMKHSRDFYEQQQLLQHSKSPKKQRKSEQQWFHLIEQGNVRWSPQ